MKKNFSVLIIGGGLAGLTSAIHLAQNNFQVILIEKNEFPKHKVCGEYLSNEVLPYLESLGISPLKSGAKNIKRFQFSSLKGALVNIDLPLGGFGMSRYTLDLLLYNKVLEEGVTILRDTVKTATYNDPVFNISTHAGKTYIADYVLGAYGKRSNVDISLSRKFIQKTSPWLGVKAHYKADFAEDLVALHNFRGGYCGLSKVESGHVNACYLTHYDVFKEYKDLQAFQKAIIEENTVLREFFNNAEMVFEKPLTISQISFDKKQPIENHIVMIGDSAGLIHPLCGNGMAIAIHSAKIAATLLTEAREKGYNRDWVECVYSKQWKLTFQKRLRNGRRIQQALLNKQITNLGISVVSKSPFLLRQIIKSTHGDYV